MKPGWLDRPLFTVTPRGILVVCAMGVLVLGTGFLFSDFLLTQSVRLLVQEDALRHTEALLLLGGDVTSKVDYAARIYKQISPGSFLVSHVQNSELFVGRLANLHGIKREKIDILPSKNHATSTYEEALVFREYCRRKGLHSATIVTEATHTGRAYWTFRRLLPLEIDLRMAAAPPERYDIEDWWKNEHGLLDVQRESLKWLYYWWVY